MKKIVYIPLDERPCNYSYLIRLFSSLTDVELICPEAELLPNKKRKGNTEELWKFLEQKIKTSDYAVISLEMLFYGGLLPSRIHQQKPEDLHKFIERLKALRIGAPHCQIYFSSLIMRTPQYSSSEQEPDYYELYGREIFEYGCLLDKRERGMATEQESLQFNKLEANIPADCLEDFIGRRQYNRKAIENLIDLVEADILDLLVIPQDDSYPYGFTAIDQSHLYYEIKNRGLNNQIYLYPGADEVGYSLLARALNKMKDRSPSVYVTYSSTKGPMIIPKYEDRMIGESLKSHLLVTNCYQTDDKTSADIILGYNTPGSEMLESGQQFGKDTIDYDRSRNLPYFVAELVRDLTAGRQVAICDSAFANGGDIQLLKMLDQSTPMLDQLLSYRAWNTNCNSLGSTLSEAIVYLEGADQHKRKENLLSTIYEDVFYEGKLRQELIDQQLDTLSITYFDLFDKEEEVIEFTHEKMAVLHDDLLQQNFERSLIGNIEIAFPWNRLFNAMFDISLKVKDK